MYTQEEIQRGRTIARFIILGSISVFIILFLYMALMPVYKVWSKEMQGRAALAEAEQNRKILIEEAKANLEAQRLNSQAEVERATGMAKAIEIENGKLTREYIYYLWVRNLDKMDGQKIYIPTESQLPILERGDDGLGVK